jgi:hypothetical protein
VLHAVGHAVNPLDRAHRRASVFLDDERHD